MAAAVSVKVVQIIGLGSVSVSVVEARSLGGIQKLTCETRCPTLMSMLHEVWQQRRAVEEAVRVLVRTKVEVVWRQ